ncbi:MAG: hypothetical protein MJ169_01405 [Treponema sp.]|nr:hypothetical protein [Treponema sp.]
MRNHPIRKSVGLIVLYAVIIVGIFVIQFRSDSIIRKNIHAMRVTLAEAETPDGVASLKNQMSLTYNGIMFLADDSNPLEYTNSKNQTVKAVLESYEEPDENSCSFKFSDDIQITFTLADDSENAPLLVTAAFPKNIAFISIKMRPQGGYSFTSSAAKQAILEGRNEAYALIAPQIQDDRLFLLDTSKLARYTTYVKQTEFAIDSIGAFAGTTPAEFKNTVNALSEGIISEFIRQSQSNASFASSLTEQSVMSFAACMGNAGRYNEGLNSVPDSFIKGSRRTYLTAPFFGNLAKVAPGIQVQMENYAAMIKQSINTRNLDIFTNDDILNYMVLEANSPHVKALLGVPSILAEADYTLLQAAGILRAYAKLSESGSANAGILDSVLDKCLKKITECCTIDSQKLRLSENETNLSVAAAAYVGDALIGYGKVSGLDNVEKCGYLVINSYLGDLSGLDLHTMTDVYPVLVHDNPYYPHYLDLGNATGAPVWAWTIAKNIGLTQNENRTVSLDIDFPLGLTHYIIVTGINPFRRIQIYNMDFRTDPQFEIYNSSGYVYRLSMKGLLLKSRHKSQHEIIRLYYRDIVENQ